MAEVVWDMSKAPYSLDETGDAKVITATAIANAATFFADTANKDTTLVLYYPPGTYHFYGTPTTSESAGIRLVGFVPGGTGDTGKLVFRGAGNAVTKFIVYNNQSHDGTNSTSQYGIITRTSYRIHFEDFHLTVSQQTVSQGTVQAIGTGYVDLLIPTGFATPAELSVDPINSAGKYLRAYTYAYDVNHPRLVSANNDQIAWTSATDQGNGVWRMSLSPTNLVVTYPIGSVVCIKGKHGKDPYRGVDCFNIEMHRLKLTRKTRCTFIACQNTVVNSMRIVREKINGVVACLASPEGGPQFQSVPGFPDTDTVIYGLNVSGCYIDGTGDDCIGLFEQSGTVTGNVVRDSFGRGIVNFDPSSGLSQAEILAQNTFIRSRYEHILP